jgi:hypothetical protein
MKQIAGILTVLLLAPPAALHAAEAKSVSSSAIPSPILFRGDATTAYRDLAAIYHDGWFRLSFTLRQETWPGKDGDQPRSEIRAAIRSSERDQP